MTESDSKLHKVTESDSKLHKMTESDSKLQKVIEKTPENACKWLQTFEYDRK